MSYLVYKVGGRGSVRGGGGGGGGGRQGKRVGRCIIYEETIAGLLSPFPRNCIGHRRTVRPRSDAASTPFE